MIRKLLAFTIGLVFFGFLFVFSLGHQALAAGCSVTIHNFEAKPNPAPANQSITFSGDFTVSGFEQEGSPNAGYCLKNNEPVKATTVTLYAGAMTAGGNPHVDNAITSYGPGPYYFSFSAKPSDANLKAGQSFSAYATVYTGNVSGRPSLAVSSTITVNVIAGIYGSWACVTDNGQGVMVYACGSDKNCSDAVGCTAEQKAACRQISDNSQCGKPASAATHKACNSAHLCVNVEGAGADTCTTDASCAAAGGGPTTTQYNFNLPNPIGVTDFQDLINIIGKWIFNLAIPIAVIIIIYAGVIMLTSGGVPARFQKGAKALWYAVIGLAVVLIGKGFVTLIQSILSLRNK
jgi:hypothetical protein